MAYSEGLAGRVRHALSRVAGVTEKRMFGGVGFLLHDHMLVGIWNASLIARVGAEAASVALHEPHVRPFDVTGRPMTGWLMIEPDGVETDRQLDAWVALACAFVRSLPPKSPKPSLRATNRKSRRP